MEFVRLGFIISISFKGKGVYVYGVQIFIYFTDVRKALLSDMIINKPTVSIC